LFCKVTATIFKKEMPQFILKNLIVAFSQKISLLLEKQKNDFLFVLYNYRSFNAFRGFSDK